MNDFLFPESQDKLTNSSAHKILDGRIYAVVMRILVCTDHSACNADAWEAL